MNHKHHAQVVNLAVRNQFFTPRYVVEFLTDNTLGRIWYEMTKGETVLLERCRYLVRRHKTKFLGPEEKHTNVSIPPELPTAERLKLEEEIPHRPIKDPRELRFLDPACGSMHFGLYAFDLLEVIYVEAWNKSIGTLRNDFPIKEEFIREVPRLILENNIYGVDIDGRAVQIARLALWLRAQKAWQQQNIVPAKRPRIKRSHIVCAEPICPDESYVDNFINTNLSGSPEKEVLGHLMRRLVNQMQLAGEAGVLLRIEEAIKRLVQTESGKDRHQDAEILPGLSNIVRQDDLVGFSITGITDKNFWNQAEQQLYQELKSICDSTRAGWCSSSNVC
jgi:hypothetical protein